MEDKMAEEKTKKPEEIGLVSLTGEIGVGIRMPNGTVVELNNVDVGTAQVLAYLVKAVSEITTNIS